MASQGKLEKRRDDLNGFTSISMSIVKENEYFGNICSTHQRVVDLVLGVTGRGVNKSRSTFQRFYVSSRPAGLHLYREHDKTDVTGLAQIVSIKITLSTPKRYGMGLLRLTTHQKIISTCSGYLGNKGWSH